MENWNRKEHFAFFNQFDDPFFGVGAEIDCTNAYTFCKRHSIPFFLYYHYQSILAVNQSEEFMFRIVNDEIVVFDTIHVTTTIGRQDNTFAFSFIPFDQSFSMFSELAVLEMDRIKKTSGLGLDKNTGRLDVIHFSTVPWISFTGITHARDFKIRDSIPKITFGKYFHRDSKMIMPVSIHVHHGLMDGFHVGRFVDLLQTLLNGS
jgi:chloramphenicol O-acetyltransferase type A